MNRNSDATFLLPETIYGSLKVLQRSFATNAYLRLSMHQDIDTELFLKLNNFIDFLLDVADIDFLRDSKGTGCKNIVKLITLYFFEDKQQYPKTKRRTFSL